MRMRFQMFRGMLSSWESLFTEAAEFATELGPDRVASISHSEDRNDGVVTVWYWTDEPGPEARPDSIVDEGDIDETQRQTAEAELRARGFDIRIR